ncbi:MAG TPA: type II toxin-antitoxin system VapC family toxin [Blastocatellia bacterium]|nr:type II toxin-antitoxin system VapC family toxin [Blastocatellia bacterium]
MPSVTALASLTNSMPKITFDTSIFIAYKPAALPAGFRMPAVVIQELTAGAVDKSDVQRWDAARRVYEQAGALLVPTGEDWWLAGKVLNSLLRGLKSKSKGLTPRLHPGEKQRIIRDALIARTVKREGALLVTNNIKDFEQIKSFCNIRMRSGKDYFGY